MYLTSDDMTKLAHLIDTCAGRGAIRGEELFVVGALREKLVRSAKVLIEEEKEPKTDTNEEPSEDK